MVKRRRPKSLYKKMGQKPSGPRAVPLILEAQKEDTGDYVGMGAALRTEPTARKLVGR